MMAKAKKELWRQRLAEATTPKDMAKLMKVMQNKQHHQIELSLTNNEAGSPKVALNNFFDNIFPGSLPWSGEISRTKNKWITYKQQIKQVNLKFLEPGTLMYLANTFKPNKAAGIDRIKPILLKNLSPKFYERLTILYKVSLALEYTPGAWCTSKVVIIPKPDKKDYSNPKSFRPMSLTPFLFKLREKLVKLQIEETTLATNPHHDQQHAFRAGRSTDMALSEAVDYIKKAPLNKEYAIGVVLDISGAFDNLTTKAAIDGL